MKCMFSLNIELDKYLISYVFKAVLKSGTALYVSTGFLWMLLSSHMLSCGYLLPAVLPFIARSTGISGHHQLCIKITHATPQSYKARAGLMEHFPLSLTYLHPNPT